MYETSKLYATLGRGSLQIGEVAGKKGQSNNIKNDEFRAASML